MALFLQGKSNIRLKTLTIDPGGRTIEIVCWTVSLVNKRREIERYPPLSRSRKLRLHLKKKLNIIIMFGASAEIQVFSPSLAHKH
jgi:hypothetical protein